MRTDFRRDRARRRFLTVTQIIRELGAEKAAFVDCYDAAPPSLSQRWRRAGLTLVELGDIKWLLKNGYPNAWVKRHRERMRAKKPDGRGRPKGSKPFRIIRSTPSLPRLKFLERDAA
jgi:hypothetical protein